jgi:hypothetical protein
LLVMEHWKTGSFVSATNVARSKLLVFKLFWSSGVLSAATVVKSRGNASIITGGRPLYVDGVPLNDSAFNAQGGQALKRLLEDLILMI